MDDTQQSRSSDAAATRKRRSSILKSQRPARTPFSELEFNVATPTDTAKSRRVSFSRRTGVAEFVTNEATTTWKNFYEEHNKSLESSGNDSEANPTRQPVEHLGRRIFDQQFEEVEAVDLIGTLAPPLSTNASFNNINFTEQIASLDYTSDPKLTAPNSKFELSALTDQQSKIFGNDFTVTGVGETSGKIDFNFSNIQRIGEQDDLDEIERDLERVSSNVVCPGPIDRHNISEYIEVDLNMTHVAKNDDCNMSITDTISTPKVQDVFRSSSIDKRNNLDEDWMTDKENIAINPYVTPLESDNFAVNDEPDQVLVFDGKRLTLQTEKSNNDFRQTLLPSSSNSLSKNPVRKTIVLNTNDDLPNFVDDANLWSDVESRTSTSYRDPNVCVKAVHKVEIVKRATLNNNADNISITRSLPTNIMSGVSENIKTIHKENEEGNISMTQSLNGQIITANSKPIERRRTVVYENETGNISITQALPTNILENDKVERRKTIVFDDDKGNISITQALTSQFMVDHIVSERRKTIIYDDDKANVSITQAIPSRVILDQKNQEKRKTIVFDDDNGNISITQALPANIVLESRHEKRKTILYEDDTGNISVTQAAPSNFILTGNPSATERRRTILYEDDTGNISVTQAIPQNIIISKADPEENTKIFDANISMTQVLPTNIILKDSDTNKRRTIVYDDETGDISITQAVPSQLITGIASKEDVTTPSDDSLKTSTSVSAETVNKRRTIIYDSEAADVSMTQVIPANIIILNQEETEQDENARTEKSIVFDNDKCDITLAEEVPANVFLLEGMTSDSGESIPVVKDTEETIGIDISKKVLENQDSFIRTEKRRTVVFANDNGDDEMSITQAVPKIQSVIHESDKSEDFDKNKGNLSLTKPIPDQLMAIHTDILNKSVKKNLSLSVQTSFCNQNVRVVVYQNATVETSQQVDNSEAPSVCESNFTVPRNTDKTEAAESLTSKVLSETTIMQSQDYVGNVIESKSEVFDIKMNILEEADKLTENVIDDVKSDTVKWISNDPNSKDSKTSVLYTLLNMSDPVESDIFNKYAETDVERSSVEFEPQPEKDASMVTFVIAEDEEIQTDKVESDKDAELTENESDTIQFVRESPLSIEYKEQEEILQNTLAQLMNKRDEIENILPNVSSTDDSGDEKVRCKSFKDANDTKELLDMISDFTDNSRCSSKERAISPVKEVLSVKKAVDVKEALAIENKMEVQEPRRLSFATKRQSIIISREDLLSNISMAQAVLQKSRVEFDDTSLTEENQDSSPEDLRNMLQRSNRLSNEVVKTLHFDDESLSENSLKSDLSKTWSIKKTVLGETSYAKDKTNVIPSYLKDVSDGIKQLMSDLVKPLSDAIPFENQEERMKRTMSTVSTQIQANLITSSQIDVNTELSSSPDSRENLEDIPCYRSGHGILKMPDSSEMSSEQEVVPNECSETLKPLCRQQSIPEPVLVFDHENPLNNILLGPLDYVHAHDYKPLSTPIAIENLAQKSDVTLCGSDRSRSCQINMEMDASSIDVMEYGAKDVEVNTEQVVQFCVAVREGQQELPIHKPCSLDRAVNVHSKVEDTEVNTVIAMKPNKELLETSSSLTLIDTLSESESKIDSSQQYIARKERRTPIKAVAKPKALSTVASDITSTDDSADHLVSKGKKRSHKPVTPNRRASVEVTPKPNSKMLKISNSPNQNRIVLHMSHEPTKLPAEKDTDENVIHHIEDESTERKPPNCTFDSTITIQQLITEYQIDAGVNKEILDVLKDTEYCKSGSLTTEAPSRSESLNSDSMDKVCSFTSSKNLGSSRKLIQGVATTASSHKSQSTMNGTDCSRIDWHPELTSSSSTKNVSYFDSGVNIVSKIDMLPFMGSYECERESSLADTWSFRLLHGRIRLTIRLVHRHDNATRTRVRADTPVTYVGVDTIEYDKKNPVAILCIRFACETMRYMVSSSSETKYLARDVPLLLRRCAAVARVALRWGRAMHEAKLHLAYTLDSEGHLTLKVANIPLRSVWEVSMDLELVVEHPSQAPWPRAGNVKVKRVVSDVPVSDEDIRKVLKHTPNDWGHAPKTLWRIFRYLKHKQRDDDELLLGL